MQKRLRNLATPSMEKKSVFSLQNFVKEEQPLTNETPRLKTFRMPRDLSLGGTKPKKLYTPNLNVIRQKNKTKEPLHSKVESRKSLRNLETRQKPLSNSRFIQTQGVFSEGSAEIKRNSVSVERHSTSYRQQDAIPIPKISKKSFNMQHTQKEDGVVDELLRSREGEDEEDAYEPLVLCREMLSKSMNLKSADRIGLEKGIKMEVDSENLTCTAADRKPVKQELLEAFVNSKQYSDSNLYFSLLQFPDSLAGRGGSDDPDDKNSDFKLKDVGEGRIGKVIIRKSGKMQLQVGAKFYDLDLAEGPKYAQDIVTIVSKDDNGDAQVGKIGTVNEQFLVIPDWKRLFHNS